MKTDSYIAYITDLHISEDGGLIRNVDVRENFRKIISDIFSFELKPDLIILGGDLAALDGEPGAYTWIKKEIEVIPTPFLILAGNHDRYESLNSCFKLDNNPETGALSFQHQINRHPILTLDSSAGEISENQLEWLENTAAATERQPLLFIHHPPLLCDCLHMDRNYPLTNRDDVLERILKIGNIPYVFCGHYHTEKTIVHKDKTFFLTPSTMFQVCQLNPSFAIDHLAPGWRQIFWNGASLKTSVRYVMSG